ncbi:MAG TPA: hypothetical protein VIQ52_17780 [Arthrobacter sp.]
MNIHNTTSSLGRYQPLGRQAKTQRLEEGLRAFHERGAGDADGLLPGMLNA